MNIDQLPPDMIRYELLPKLSLSELSSLARTSKKYKNYVQVEIDKRLQKGELKLRSLLILPGTCVAG